jgi:hypothetical protein
MKVCHSKGYEGGNVEDCECEKKMVIVKTVTLRKKIQMVKRARLIRETG